MTTAARMTNHMTGKAHLYKGVSREDTRRIGSSLWIGSDLVKSIFYRALRASPVGRNGQRPAGTLSSIHRIAPRFIRATLAHP